MLAPGDTLLSPVPPERNPQPPANSGGQPINNTAPRPEAKESEPRSFLMTLMRALGAIHT